MASNLVTRVRNLQQRKGRKRSGLALAEGVRLVEEAMAAGVPIRGALISPVLAASERGAALARTLAARAVPLEELSDSVLRDLADTETPQGVVAVVEPPRFQLADTSPGPRAPVLVLDEVQDPGNVGALIRTAFALGASGVIVLPGTADLTNSKVLRGAMGAGFRIPTVRATVGELAAWIKAGGVSLWVAEPSGVALCQVASAGPVAIVVGNEGAGVTQAVRDLPHRKVAIPLARGAESLNVAVAAGIILYEVVSAD